MIIIPAFGCKEWRKMTKHLDKINLYDEKRRPLDAINEELKKFSAVFDPVLGEVVFVEEKGYTFWLLKWG